MIGCNNSKNKRKNQPAEKKLKLISDPKTSQLYSVKKKHGNQFLTWISIILSYLLSEVLSSLIGPLLLVTGKHSTCIGSKGVASSFSSIENALSSIFGVGSLSLNS